MKKEKLGELHYHEILDRSSVILDSFYEHLQTHPAVEAHGELKDLAQEVMDILYKFYCTCGAYPNKITKPE